MDKDLYAYGIDLKEGEKQPDITIMISEDSMDFIDTDVIIKMLNEQYKDQINGQKNKTTKKDISTKDSKV